MTDICSFSFSLSNAKQYRRRLAFALLKLAFTNKFPQTPENPGREKAGISLCYIRKLLLKSDARTHAHTHTLTAAGMHMPAHTNTHGYTITCPSSSVTSKAHYLIQRMRYQECAHICIANTHSRTKTFSACESCLETRREWFHLLQLDVFHGNRILTTSQLDETCAASWPNGRDHTGAVTDNKGGAVHCIYSCHQDEKLNLIILLKGVFAHPLVVLQVLSPGC